MAVIFDEIMIQRVGAFREAHAPVSSILLTRKVLITALDFK